MSDHQIDPLSHQQTTTQDKIPNQNDKLYPDASAIVQPQPLATSQVIQLQRLIGNHAVTHLVQSIQRQSTTPAPQAQFHKFLNSGTGLTGHALGQVDVSTYSTNAVEIVFKVDAATAQQYRNITARQWAGPEVIWIKQGTPLRDGGFRAESQSPGTGADDPDPHNVVRNGEFIAYYDSPGVSQLNYLRTRPSRIHVVQNFTGWLEGEPRGGGRPRRICRVVSWHSIVSLTDSNWNDPSAMPSYHRMPYNQSGTGWRSISTPPDL